MPAEKLNARKVDAIKKPGRYSDGRNLYLQVTPSGGKSWALLYTLNGRHRQMGLGALEFLPLSEARDAALEARRLIRKGIDPIEARRADAVRPAAPTFGEVEAQTLSAMKAKWTSARSANQWEASMRDYVLPTLQDRPVPAPTPARSIRQAPRSWPSTAKAVSQSSPLWTTRNRRWVGRAASSLWTWPKSWGVPCPPWHACPTATVQEPPCTARRIKPMPLQGDG